MRRISECQSWRLLKEYWASSNLLREVAFSAGGDGGRRSPDPPSLDELGRLKKRFRKSVRDGTSKPSPLGFLQMPSVIGALVGGLGVDPHKGGLGGGGGSRGRVTRHLLPQQGAESAPRRSVPQRSSSTPRQAGPPSRRPIRPKQAAISRLLARNVKRDLARLGNREIAGVLERGAEHRYAAYFSIHPVILRDALN
jgi:hypothetical protein